MRFGDGTNKLILGNFDDLEANDCLIYRHVFLHFTLAELTAPNIDQSTFTGLGTFNLPLSMPLSVIYGVNFGKIFRYIFACTLCIDTLAFAEVLFHQIIHSSVPIFQTQISTVDQTHDADLLFSFSSMVVNPIFHFHLHHFHHLHPLQRLQICRHPENYI